MVGRRNQRTFRVVVQEARSKLQGKFVEDLGWYNPHTNQVAVNRDRVTHWLSVGARPTERAAQVLKKASPEGAVAYRVREGRKKKKKEKASQEQPERAHAGVEESAQEREEGETAPPAGEQDQQEGGAGAEMKEKELTSGDSESAALPSSEGQQINEQVEKEEESK